MTIHPINPNFVVLSDDPPETTSGGIVVNTTGWRTNLDFHVVAGGGEGFGVGDRVVLDDPMCGERIMLDGIPMRVVPVEHVIGVVD